MANLAKKGDTWHIINNITSSVQNFGLFSSVSGHVSNIYFSSVSITTTGAKHEGDWVNVGVVAGTNTGTINNCYITDGTMNIDRVISNVGGFVGCNKGTVESSNSRGLSIRGNGNLGGIVGKNESPGLVSRCSAYGTTVTIFVKGTVSVGGIVGWNCDGAKVADSVYGAYISFDNKIEDPIRVGYIIGHNQGTYDNKGSSTGWGAAVYSKGLWYDNSEFLFAKEGGRVGKEG